MRRFHAAVFILFSFLFMSQAPEVRAQSASETEIVFDASGSMNDAMGTGTKLDAAKQVMNTIAGQIQEGANVGLRFFGTTEVKDNIRESCSDSTLALPIGPFQKQAMIDKVQPIKSYGMTALGLSLQKAGADFSKDATVSKTIILISDGEETCGMDPLKVVADLKSQGITFQIHAIGFDASEAGKAQLKQLGESTGGSYRDAKDAGELQASLQQVAEQSKLLTVHRGGGDNILAASAGATIVSASNQNIAQLIDGKEDEVNLAIGDNAVFAFKNKQPVKLEKFSMPTFKNDDRIPSKIDFFGSTENAPGKFFRIGSMNPENKVVFGNIYQEYKFDPAPAIRYFKAVMGNPIGGGWNYLIAHEWHAEGKYLSEEEFKTELAKLPAPEINLLSPENGGQFIAGASTDMAALIDGKGEDPGASASFQFGAEAIFGFEKGKTVTLTKLKVPVLKQDQMNCKTLEFFASETSPTGPFASLGTFQTTNMVFAGNPYQEYALSKPAKAKYLKVKAIDSWGGYYCVLPELQAYGESEK